MLGVDGVEITFATIFPIVVGGFGVTSRTAIVVVVRNWPLSIPSI
jgi:hypothetical protein